MYTIDYFKKMRRKRPVFFLFIVAVLFLYSLQLLLKVEITPLGYFSLYSNPTPQQKEYFQILPSDSKNSVPIDIYQVRGSGFLMLEILPTRYKILSESENCNQMQYKLNRLGLKSVNAADCEDLKRFNTWFRQYAKRLGLILEQDFQLCEYGFQNGKISSRQPIQTKPYKPENE